MLIRLQNVLREFPNLQYVNLVSPHEVEGDVNSFNYVNSLYEVANAAMEMFWSDDTWAMPQYCTVKLQDICQNKPSAAWQSQHLYRDSSPRMGRNVIISETGTHRDMELFGEPSTSDFGSCIEKKTGMAWIRR